MLSCKIFPLICNAINNALRSIKKPSWKRLGWEKLSVATFLNAETLINNIKSTIHNKKCGRENTGKESLQPYIWYISQFKVPIRMLWGGGYFLNMWSNFILNIEIGKSDSTISKHRDIHSKLLEIDVRPLIQSLSNNNFSQFSVHRVFWYLSFEPKVILVKRKYFHPHFVNEIIVA